MILLQILTVFFAVACAWLNKWPVVTFRYYGLNRDGEKDFHMANALVKILWTVLAAIHQLQPNLWIVVIISLLILLIQWFVFDIALNIFTKSWKEWDYTGETATIDRLIRFGISLRLFKWRIKIPGFGRFAGKIKAAAVLLFITALNVLLCVL